MWYYGQRKMCKKPGMMHASNAVQFDTNPLRLKSWHFKAGEVLLKNIPFSISSSLLVTESCIFHLLCLVPHFHGMDTTKWQLKCCFTWWVWRISRLAKEKFCPLEDCNIFNIRSKIVIEECQFYFNFSAVSDQIAKRAQKFLVKYENSGNILCAAVCLTW